MQEKRRRKINLSREYQKIKEIHVYVDQKNLFVNQVLSKENLGRDYEGKNEKREK